MKLDHTRIAPHAPFLRMTDIRPGDVILSRGKSHFKNRFEPTLIAWATGGAYSHAAVFIWLKPPAEGTLGILQLIESEDQGAGWTLLTKFGLALDGSSFEDVAALPGAPSDAALFRHEMKNVPPEEIIEASKKIGEQQLFMAYPPLIKLMDATPYPSFMKGLLRRAVAHEAKKHNSFASGSFCSQLVAQFFELLNVPLFGVPRQASEVSPNDLAKSNLKQIEHAVISSKMIQSATVAEVNDPRDLVQSDSTRTSYLLYITELKAFGKMMTQHMSMKMAALSEFQAQRLGTFYVNTRSRTKKDLEAFPKSLATAFSAGYPSDPTRNVWADEMDDTLLYLVSMDRVLDSEDHKDDPSERRRTVRLQFLQLQQLILTQLNLDLIEFWKDTMPPEQRPDRMKAYIEEFEQSLAPLLQQLEKISADVPKTIAELRAEEEFATLLAEANQELERILPSKV
jgi:hypothetical protein